MIIFRCRKRHPDGTPIVKDVDIIAYAEAQLADYRPELLEVPGKIDPEHFIEKYLEANIDYQDLYYEEGTSPLAGAAVFNNESVRIFDRENKCIKDIPVEARTVIIDNKTVEIGKEGFARFTKLHEAGHLCIHHAVYTRIPGQMTLFDGPDGGVAARNIVLCKREAIGNHKRQLVTQEDFREHQANVYAAALEMPNRTFEKLTRQLIRQYDIGRERNQLLVIPHEFNYDFELGRARIISELAETYGASRTAVEIQLRARGLLMTEKEYIRWYNEYRFRNGYNA